MKDLVEYIVRPLVAHPDDVNVSVVEGAASVLLELSVNSADVAVLRDNNGDGLLGAMQKVLAVAGGDRRPVLDLLDGPVADAAEE
jgi:predicted RNA-binding protein YlqC (UPF0109 family)